MIIILCSLTWSCKEEVEPEQPQERSRLLNTEKYGDPEYRFPELLPEARNAVASWSVFEDFELEARTLNDNTIQALQNKTGRLMTHTDSLSTKLPPDLLTNPIYSRLNVVKTYVHLLDQQVHKPVIDSAAVQQNLLELNNAIRNLILQINEKFQKEAIDSQRKEDEQKELQKQKKFLDSVYRAELRDKKQ